MVAGEPTSNEEWITYKDNGQRALLETVKTPMYDNEGRLIGVLGIARDITERMQIAEDRLKMEREFQQTQIFQTISDSIIMIDKEGRLAHFNATAGSVCNYTSDLIGSKLSEICLGCASECGSALLETLHTGVTKELCRFECHKPGGNACIVSLKSTPITETDGTVSGAVAVIRDETHSVGLEHSLKKRGQFHGIIGFSDKMQRVYSLIEALAARPAEDGDGHEQLAHGCVGGQAPAQAPRVQDELAALAEPAGEGFPRGGRAPGLRQEISRAAT
jgi:PAS domain S-box-containing protein